MSGYREEFKVFTVLTLSDRYDKSLSDIFADRQDLAFEFIYTTPVLRLHIMTKMSYLSLTKEEEARMHPIKTVRCVMMSGDSSPPPLRVSVPPSPGFDITDDARPGKTSPTSTSKTLKSSDTEAIEEAVPIMEKKLPEPEPKPKVERNGPPYDTLDGKKLVDDDDDSCVIKCISFTQQCCDCTVL